MHILAFKVLIVTGIFPPDIGGPATYIPQLACALAERGHEIKVLTLSDHLGYDDTHYPFPVVRLQRRLFKPWRWLCTVAKLIRMGRDANILYVNGLFLESWAASVFLRKPTVQKVVGDFAWERATNWGWVKDNFEDFQKKRYGLKIQALKEHDSQVTKTNIPQTNILEMAVATATFRGTQGRVGSAEAFRSARLFLHP